MLHTKMNRLLIIKAILMWSEYFDDGIDWVSDYFNAFDAEKNLCHLSIDDNPVSVLMACQYQWRYNKEVIPFVYLSGICTIEKYRRQGYSSRLIKDVLQKSYKEDKILCGLIVANEDLKKFYKKFGFVLLNHQEGIPIFEQQYYSPEEIQLMFKQKKFDNLDNSIVHSRESLSLYSDEYYKTIDCSSNLNMQMFRIINTEKALTLYAKKYPQKDLVFDVKDKDIEANNHIFAVKEGKVSRLDSAEKTNMKQITIEELTSIVFENAFMFLMNER